MTELSLHRTPSFRLDGRRALVTGASQGIGFAAAQALAEAGAHVTLAARSADKVEAAARAIRDAGGLADSLPMDVTNTEQTSAAIERLGPFQILVNNAGGNRPQDLLDITKTDYDAIVDLNVKAALFVVQAVVRGLVAAGLPGSIINMSSQMGLVGGPKRAVYCATKHAVEGMTKAMAWEFGAKGIRVNTICPTFIETPMTAGMLDDAEFRAYVESKIALGRVGRVEDLMGAVVFLASDAAALITGAALVVDGGWTAA